MRNVKILLGGILVSLAALAGLAWAEAPAGKTPAADVKAFSTKVAPILQKNCLSCHNPKRARGSLDLSSRAALLEGGDKGPALIPGDAKKSLLAHMIQGEKPKMPKMAPPLPAADVQALLQWIDDGAPWPDDVRLAEADKKDPADWWSFRSLQRPALPEVKDKTWSDNPIDRFILAGLEAKGLRPNPPADLATLLRRMTYDLHGLPPTPEELDAFLKAAQRNLQAALEEVVERLLASPRYAERWARHWLDIIHYADTHGFDKDKRRLWAWLFRDWLIRGLHADMPYRRFVRQQVAGDVLFPGDPDGIIATGFVVAGPWDFVGQVELREGTVDKEKTRNLDRDDMVANTLATFNSLTVHCARCHDHKFDPIPQKDYYQLQAVFAGVERGDRPVPNQEILARRQELTKKRQGVQEERAALLASLRQTPELAKVESDLAEVAQKLAKLPQADKIVPSPTNGYHSGIEAKPLATKWVQVDLGESMALDVVRLVPARPTDFADSPGFGFPQRFKLSLSDDPAFAKEEVLTAWLDEDYPNPGVRGVSVHAQGKKARFIRVTAQKLWERTKDYVFALAEVQAWQDDMNLAQGKKVTALDSIEAGRWSTKYLVDNCDSRQQLEPPEPARLRFALESRHHDLVTIQNKLLNHPANQDLRTKLDTFQTRLDAIDRDLQQAKEDAKVYAVLPIKPRPIHVLARGDVERKGAAALPGSLPTIFPHLNHHFDKLPADQEGARRAALAGWLTDDANALTWRSIVNRVWHYHFGKGLVDTPNDFGRQGNAPSHPELLDWLASEFRAKDSFKHLHRLIVTSQAYRQSSAHNDKHARIDGDNRLLWRQNRQRLDAEAIRDSVLAVSGKLDLTMHGPGFDLFRFKDDHSPIYDHLDLKRINAPDTWRRTVYRFVVRSVPNPFLDSLDCADPNISVPARNTTLTALQALAMLNNPFMVQQSEHFAQRVHKAAKEPEGRISAAFRLALGRAPTAEEGRTFAAFVQRHGLPAACRLLLNCNEFVFVD